MYSNEQNKTTKSLSLNNCFVLHNFYFIIIKMFVIYIYRILE